MLCTRSCEVERAARAYTTGSRRARRPRARSWLALALVAALPSLAGCGAVDFLNELDEPDLDLGRMETDIRSELQRDLESRARTTRGSVATVGRVRCRQRSDIEATCFARVSRRGRSRRRELAVSVDPDTGRYRWEIVR